LSIFTASSENLETLWPLALPHLERFAQETLLASPQDVLEDLRTGAKQLWLYEEGALVVGVIVTEIYETMKGRVCCIWAACGTVGVHALKPTFDEIEAWARSIHCATVEVRGRKGWARILDGFKQTGVLLEKDLRQVH
jgi:hypothetical protein